jgi:gliding motility-associated-like protein
VTDPEEGAMYNCTMTSATGCTVTKQSEIAKYVPAAGYDSYMIDCVSNSVQLVNTSSTTHGKLEYQWDFGDGNQSEEENPRYMFSTSGLHHVSLILINPPSACSDTLYKDVESFSPPLVGIEGDSTYCPQSGVTLTAFGAWSYTWSTGSASDSIEVTAPGGSFWMIGRSSTGCVSDTLYLLITEEPDWRFVVTGDSILCEGSLIELVADTDAELVWNTGADTDTISVTSPGTYTVVATNARGCQKSDTLLVKEYPIPNVSFSSNPSSLNIRHTQLTCNIPEETGVLYTWDMGDNSSEFGSTVVHTYAVTNSNPSYVVELTAVSGHGCTDSSYRVITVVPFIPNVFTPNGDGINDLFMQSVETRVMDRNGILIYTGNEGWDGSYNGRKVDPDTYFYTVFYYDWRQEQQTLKGFITLIR